MDCGQSAASSLRGGGRPGGGGGGEAGKSKWKVQERLSSSPFFRHDGGDADNIHNRAERERAESRSLYS